MANGETSVVMQRSGNQPTPDIWLWMVIRRSALDLSFNTYTTAIDALVEELTTSGGTPPTSGSTSASGLTSANEANQQEMISQYRKLHKRRKLPFNGIDAYQFLKVATEAFLLVKAGVLLSENNRLGADDISDARRRLGNHSGDIKEQLREQYLQELQNDPAKQTLPYLAYARRKLRDVGLAPRQTVVDDHIAALDDINTIIETKLTAPLLMELIWSYWHEEGMLVQSVNAISRRFQNVRNPGPRDPLASLAIDPLRPLGNLLWGYIQDEQHRLTLVRRAYEYDHHYGFTLYCKAVPKIRPVDSRSKFLEAFHNLLYLATIFFQQDDDTTVIADAFPLLNALKEVHLLLSQGAHNQFGDLPSTARQEMLIQQWLLARPEFREFLPTRIMVAYPEPWMDRVDAMKGMQGWGSTSVLHFSNLGAYGEQLLLSIRYGAWMLPDTLPLQASNWARFWRTEIQGYIHAYRAVTGIDLSADITDNQRANERYLQPAVHLQRQLAAQRNQALPAPAPTTALARPRQRTPRR